MKTWQIVPILFGLAAAGCRSDPSKELLERDNWTKEQEIYRLQARVDELEETLKAGQPAGRGPARNYPRGETSPNPPGRRGSEPEVLPPGGINISPGTEAPPGEVPERMRVPGGSPSGEGGPARPISMPGGPSLGGLPTGASPQWSPAGSRQLAGNSALSENSTVAQITLHPALTGGIGTSRHSGDEGLLVVVEPRDFAGKIVTVPGDISVALLDPALSGEQARLARWDFPAAQTQGMIRTGAEPGIHLRLPWISTPAHDRLKVFVRFTTRDGRRLQTERLIGVALSDPLPAEREVPPNAVKPTENASRPQWSPVR